MPENECISSIFQGCHFGSWLSMVTDVMVSHGRGTGTNASREEEGETMGNALRRGHW